MSETTLSYDILIIGAGPAGLSAALHLRRLAPNLSVGVLEKARRIGGQVLSGALVHPRDLTLLENPPWDAPVTREEMVFLTRRNAATLPVPARHAGCAMISLSRLCRALGEAAEQAGADVLPGFAGERLIFEGERVAGVVAAGTGIRANTVMLAEGCRGHLSGEVIRRYGLRSRCPPQTFGLGLKEVWEVPEGTPGEVVHTVGWPLDRRTHGGGFLYHMNGNRVALGLVVALDYRDAGLDPHALLRRWREHPRVAGVLRGGRPVAFGARCLVEGGWQGVPELAFPGGMLLGDAAGFLDPCLGQGIGGAVRSGMAAAEAVAAGGEGYGERMAATGWMRALRAHRNVRPAFRGGREVGWLHAGLSWFAGGREPWTLRWRRRDRACLEPVRGEVAPPAGGVDQLLALAALRHREGQPCHVRVEEAGLAGNERFAFPEVRYCPGRVFTREGGRLVLHPGNCLHCKTCDIKDPGDAIRWLPPEGGSGPDYGGM